MKRHSLFFILAPLTLGSCSLNGLTDFIPSGPQEPEEVSMESNRKNRAEITEEGDLETVRLRGIEPFIVNQREKVWCWAACTEMIMRYDGQEASQERIAARVHGYKAYANDPNGKQKVIAASYHDMLHALCPNAPKTDFEAVWRGIEDDVLAADPTTAGNREIDVNESKVATALYDKYVPERAPPIDELKMGHPAVVGLHLPGFPDSGHAYLLIGSTYTPEGFLESLPDTIARNASGIIGQPELGAVATRFEIGPDVVRLYLVNPDGKDDPLTEIDERIEVMEIEEFLERVDFVLTQADAQRILTGFQDTVELQ